MGLFFNIDIIVIISMIETQKRLSKQGKLPILKQLSEQRLPSLGKIDSLKRENSSQNIANQSFKTLFKPKNVEENVGTGKTLLKSGGYFNRPSLMAKIDIKEAGDGNKNMKLLRKANDFHHFSKQNILNPYQIHTLERPTPIQQPKDALPTTPSSNSIEDEQLRQSLLNFHQSNLSSGVKLKVIDLQQD